MSTLKQEIKDYATLSTLVHRLPVLRVQNMEYLSCLGKGHPIPELDHFPLNYSFMALLSTET